MKNWDMGTLCALLFVSLVIVCVGIVAVAEHREKMALIERMSPEDAKAALGAGK